MDFTHYDLGVVPASSIVIVTLEGTEANVCLMDDLNFSRYHSADGFTHVGGHYTQSPVRLAVPTTGHWHVTIDLGGAAGSVRSSVQVIRAP